MTLVKTKKIYGFGWLDNVINFLTKGGSYFAIMVVGIAIIIGFITDNLVFGFGNYQELTSSIAKTDTKIDDLNKENELKINKTYTMMLKELKEINNVLTDIKIAQTETQIKQEVLNSRIKKIEDYIEENTKNN